MNRYLLKKRLKLSLLVIVLILLLPVGVILLNIVTDYNPIKISLIEESENHDTLIDTLRVDILTWNIAYSGLNSGMDFFKCGGENVRSDKITVMSTFMDIKKYLLKQKNVDIFLLQEVDNNSKRSFFLNQADDLWDLKLRESFFAYYAVDYKVRYYPLPLFSPLGRIESGLVSISRYHPSSVIRYSLPQDIGYVKKSFLRDKCILVNRYFIDNGKTFLVINVNLREYNTREGLAIEMQTIRDFALEEYKAGNYVCMGGDWNQCPPDFKAEYKDDLFDNDVSIISNSLFPDDWQFIYQNKATTRNLDKPYLESKSLTTTSDFFIISPNLIADTVYVENQNFSLSNHNPVFASFLLK